MTKIVIFIYLSCFQKCMKSINQEVHRILANHISIQRTLDLGVVNIRALAMYLIETNDLKASLHSVISAIRRFEVKEKEQKKGKKIADIFKSSVISIRNNMSCFTLSISLSEAIAKLQKLDSKAVDKSYRIISSADHVKLFADKSSSRYLHDLFSKEQFHDTVDNLTEIGITVQKEAIKTKGVIARISNEIALYNINIFELLIIPPTFLIYVKDKDAVRTHALLHDLHTRGW